MNKTRLVFYYDLINRITRPGFWLWGILVPVLGLGLVMGMNYLQERTSSFPGLQPRSTQTPSQVIGYVDEAHLLRVIPDDTGLQAFPDEAAARAALEQDAIQLYYLIPADYLESGRLLAYTRTFLLTDFDSESFPDPRLQALIQFNLLGADQEKLELLTHPMQLTVETTAPPSNYDDSNPFAFYIPYSVTLLFYFFIMMSASLLLSAINVEKQNRLLETLLITLNPRDLLAGKMLSLGLLSLFQLLVWAGSGVLILRLGGKTLSIPPGMELPFSLLTWGIPFFILGYALYASLMAGIGALITDLREASQVTLLVISPLMIPLFFITLLIQEPHGVLATVLSLVPFTAPVVMMMRLALGHVPLWQPIVALVGLGIVAPLILRATANLFRAQIMLTGQPLTVKRYLLALLGRI